jgi:hypothetical protein
VDEAADGCGAHAAADHFGHVLKVADVTAEVGANVLGSERVVAGGARSDGRVDGLYDEGPVAFCAFDAEVSQLLAAE